MLVPGKWSNFGNTADPLHPQFHNHRFNHSPHAQWFKRPKHKASEMRKKRFIDWEATNQGDESPNGSSNHVKKVQSSSLFYVKGRGNGGGCFCKTQAVSRKPLMISMSTCKTKHKLLMWRPGKQHRLEQGGVRDWAFHGYTTTDLKYLKTICGWPVLCS